MLSFEQFNTVIRKHIIDGDDETEEQDMIALHEQIEKAYLEIKALITVPTPVVNTLFSGIKVSPLHGYHKQ